LFVARKAVGDYRGGLFVTPRLQDRSFSHEMIRYQFLENRQSDRAFARAFSVERHTRVRRFNSLQPFFE
jgi:hypothetical protein